MHEPVLISNANIVNEGRVFKGSVFVRDQRIEKIVEVQVSGSEGYKVIDASGMYLIPGVIDDQVHFREPGLEYKADIRSESRAAVAGGITSFMEMPNTRPPVLTQKLLEDKFALAAEKSMANYSFYMGTSNDNLEEVLKVDPKTTCGLKVFMGSSTGNMLVDDEVVLDNIFSKVKMLIATHCEDEPTVRANNTAYKEKWGDKATAVLHPEIRSAEACYLSSAKAVRLAKKHNTRLHILHLSTAEEMELFSSELPLSEKKITGEVCVHHLWFSDEDYPEKGNFIKWNPAIKSSEDRDALWNALRSGKLDVIATDHAPHSLEEKQRPYFEAPAGGPLVQHALAAMLEFVNQQKITIEEVVQKMCHNPAVLFQVKDRGYIRKGYFADMVLVDPNDPWTVTKENLFYKCAWSPFEGQRFSARVKKTFVNGSLVYDEGRFDESFRGMRLLFDR
ncbi:MAG: dihydroorotase [Bacteroidales bacterium]|nr:dihydroorotase [Bacteroidales bacterium]